jgi:large subunit ribosomal protein L21
VQLGEVLLVGGESPVLGTPTVAGASVAAEVLQHKRGPKVIAFKKRRRKNSRRKRGYRDEITVLRITEILTNDNKPTIGPRPKREKVAVAAADADDEAPKAAKKKAASRNTVAKKAATKPRAKKETKKAPAKKAAAKGKSGKK